MQKAEVRAREAEDVSQAPESGGQLASHGGQAEDPSRYCPVCSRRLESRRCKLICSICGYYMSCADYY
jgi:hypothetical protein